MGDGPSEAPRLKRASRKAPANRGTKCEKCQHSRGGAERDNICNGIKLDAEGGAHFQRSGGGAVQGVEQRGGQDQPAGVLEPSLRRLNDGEKSQEKVEKCEGTGNGLLPDFHFRSQCNSPNTDEPPSTRSPTRTVRRALAGRIRSVREPNRIKPRDSPPFTSCPSRR